MTSTPVKDVGAVLNSLGSAAGSSAKTSAGDGFRTVLNGQTGQTGKGAAESQADKTQAAVKKAPGDSLKAKDEHLARTKKPDTAAKPEAETDGEEEIPEEKLEEILAAVGPLAEAMIQEIADTFGISPEEIQGMMKELGMEPVDVLDQSRLGELLLKVTGAENPYALVTDGELYDSYQELMGKLETALQEAGGELRMEPEELEELLPRISEELKGTADIQKQLAGLPAEEPEIQEEAPQQTDGPQIQIIGDNAEEVPSDNSRPQSQTESGRREDHGEARGDRQEGFPAQEIRAPFQTQQQPQVQQAQAASVWNTDTQDIMRQIMDYMKIQVRPGMSDLEMQLHPESLGTLQIHLSSRGGVVTANFITQNEAVKAALEGQMIQLRESFEQQGVKVEAVEVTVQSHAFERNLDQGRGRGGAQDQSPRKARIRKIDLNDAAAVESLEEEDALAAQIMAASGSQVDYTA